MTLFPSLAPMVLAAGLIWGPPSESVPVSPELSMTSTWTAKAPVAPVDLELTPEPDPAPQPGFQARAQDPDFQFRRPLISLSLRGGAFLPRAQGQFYDFIFRELTLDAGDLRSFTGGAELGFWVGEFAEVFASLDLTGVTRDVEWRDWDEEINGTFIPITQTVRLRNGPAVSVGLKGYPLGRGEQLSRFIWTPSPVAPFVSGGVGIMGYEVEQWGDWVVTQPGDPNFGSIFTDEFSYSDQTLLSFLGAGADVSLGPRLGVTLEGRYIWSEDRLGGDFVSFDRPLDLSGLRLTAGLSYRF